MTDNILLCSDLDRTLLPNGSQPESPQARERLHRLAERPEIKLAYVTGRNRGLIGEAIATYDLPLPDYAVGDVGATIYRISDGQWREWDAWAQQIAPDWNGRNHDQIAALFEGISELEMQESDKQGRFKLSYYTPEQVDRQQLKKKMTQRLQEDHIRSSLIWSVDEAEHQGLMDILPERATKHHAVRFVMQQNGFSDQRTVFAGDSGNDMPALTSGLQAILVRNAGEALRTEALNAMQAKGMPERLYTAKGDFLGMNGNYTAGVLEGLAHFIPETAAWMK